MTSTFFSLVPVFEAYLQLLKDDNAAWCLVSLLKVLKKWLSQDIDKNNRKKLHNKSMANIKAGETI